LPHVKGFYQLLNQRTMNTIKRLLAYLFGGSNKGAMVSKMLIRDWLQPEKIKTPVSITSTYNNLKGMYKLCDKKAIQAHVRAMDYTEFLSTPYWYVVYKYLKLHEQCKNCGSVRALELHHKSYKHIGLEILHESDMEVLCHTCHTKHHAK